jgi:sugar lactone lactonase YvrE
MNGRTRGIVLAGALAALVADVGPAAAQFTLKGIAGRGIGDGRQAPAATLDTPVGVAFDSDGALLIADADHSRVRRVDPSTGVITTAAGTVSGALGDSFPPTGIEMKSPWRVLRTPAGDLLIAEKGGARVRRVRHDTGLVDTLAGTGSAGYSGDGGPANAATLSQPQDIAVDSVGNVYIADFNNHAVRMVDTNGVISTIAGNGTAGFAGDGGPAAGAQLAFPACVLIAPGDVLYVCDKGNHVIRRISGGIITTVAGVPGSGGFNGDGVATATQLFEPEDLALAPDGSLILADARNNRVRQIVVGGNVTTLAGTGTSAFAGDDVPAASSPLAAPFGVAVRSDGTVFIAERDAERVRAIQGGNLVTVAGDGIAGFGGDGGPAADATFDGTKGLALDAQGNMYIADSANNRIRKVDTNGVVSTIAGNGTTTYGVDDVPATVVGLDGPSDVVVDGAGNVIFTDTNHHRIRFVDPQGDIHLLVGTGDPSFGADGAPAAQTAIQHPTGLTWDPNGSLVFADFDNNRIRRLKDDGTLETIAGNGQQGFAGDGGPATQASLYNPVDMAFDAQGELFIADFRNQRVRKIDASGIITTIAGTGQAAGSADFQPATIATLNGPTDVAVDSTGNVLIVDSGSNRVRRVSPRGVIDSIGGQRTPGDAGDDGPATSGFLLDPLRVLLVSGRVYVADHGNSRIRALDGQIEPSYSVTGHLPAGSGGGGAGGGGGGGAGNTGCQGSLATCVAGGGPKKTDCWLEFEVQAAPHGQRVVCTDGDPSCDRDQTPGQCTFQVTPCLDVQDGRARKCNATSLTSVTVLKPANADGEGLARALSTAAAGQMSARATVTFTSAVTRTTCGTPATVVVPTRRRKAGKTALVALAQATKGKDKDRLVLVCKPKK